MFGAPLPSELQPSSSPAPTALADCVAISNQLKLAVGVSTKLLVLMHRELVKRLAVAKLWAPTKIREKPSCELSVPQAFLLVGMYSK
jgi:hypothetical protein